MAHLCGYFFQDHILHRPQFIWTEKEGVIAKKADVKEIIGDWILRVNMYGSENR